MQKEFVHRGIIALAIFLAGNTLYSQTTQSKKAVVISATQLKKRAIDDSSYCFIFELANNTDSSIDVGRDYVLTLDRGPGDLIYQIISVNERDTSDALENVLSMTSTWNYLYGRTISIDEDESYYFKSCIPSLAWLNKRGNLFIRFQIRASRIIRYPTDWSDWIPFQPL